MTNPSGPTSWARAIVSMPGPHPTSSTLYPGTDVQKRAFRYASYTISSPMSSITTLIAASGDRRFWPVRLEAGGQLCRSEVRGFRLRKDSHAHKRSQETILFFKQKNVEISRHCDRAS